MPCCEEKLLLLPPLVAGASSFLSFVFHYCNAIRFLFSFAPIEKKERERRKKVSGEMKESVWGGSGVGYIGCDQLWW